MVARIRGVGGWVAKDTNRVTNPSLEAAAVDWDVPSWMGGAGTAARVGSATAFEGGNIFRAAITTQPTSGPLNVRAETIPAAAGQTWKGGVYVRCGAVNARARLDFYFYTAANALISIVAGDYVDILGTGWVLITNAAAIAPATTAFVRPVIAWGGPNSWAVAGTNLDHDLALAQREGTLVAPFSGATANTPTRMYSWAGTANASASIASEITAQGSTTPTLVLTHESAREARTIVHAVIGRPDPVAVIRAAATRSGTLELFYTTETAALAAEVDLTRQLVFQFTDDERPTFDMLFVVVGRITRRLDENKRRFIVTTGFQEVYA